MDVYAVKESQHVYDVSVTPRPGTWAGRWQAEVVLETDSVLSEYQRIIVPVTVEGSSLLQPQPRSVFFLAGPEQAEQEVRLIPGPDECVIETVEADHDFISAAVAGQASKGPLILNIRCRSNGAKGIIKGEVRILARSGELRQTITIPYVVVSR